MRKKLFFTVIVICLALLFTASVVACTGDGNTDETPGNTDVTPGGDDVTPGGDDVTPGGDDVTPGGDDTGITPEGEFTFTDLGNDQWSVAKYNGNRAHVVIPSTYKGGAVVAIGDEAFGDDITMNLKLKSVVIPDSVTTIGEEAFAGCLELTSVTIGDSVTTIGEGAFYSCMGLTAVEIPDSVTTIGEGAFVGCIGLTSITIGEYVTAIGEYAFEACYKLVEIYNKSNLNLTAGSDDYGGIGLCAKNIYNEGNESKLSRTDDGYIFYYDGTDAYLMGYCGDEINLILPDNFTAYNGEEITSYKIHMAAFAYNIKITSVVISDAVDVIGEMAFAICPSLVSITIGESVTDMADLVFGDCFKLIEVCNKSNLNITAGSEENGYVGFFAKNVYTEEGGSKLTYTDDGYIFYYDGSEGYLLGYCGDEKELTLPDSFTAYDGTTVSLYGIYQYAFSKYVFPNYDLTSVDISNSVTTIGDSAFADCTGLTLVEIPDSVITIGNSAFGYCNALTSVTIGDSVTKVGSTAFAYCDSLTSVTIGNSVSVIESWAFYDCPMLTSVEIPDSVTTIGEYAFGSCTALTSFVIPDSVTTIGEYAFGYCPGLTSVTIGESVTTIGDYAFNGSHKLIEVYNKSDLNITAGSVDNGYVGCYAKNVYTDEGGSKLSYTDDGYIFYYDGTDAYLMGYCGDERALTLPDGFTAYDGTQINFYEIHQYAFSICEVLTSVVISDSVTTIGDSAFYGCAGLTSLTIPDSVTSIGSAAFQGCVELTFVAIPDSVTAIGNYAFGYCAGLTSVTIGESVTTIGDSAFYGCTGLTSLVIPDSVTTIGTNAFSDCTQLIEIENGVSYVDKWAVDFDDSVAEVTLRNDTVGIANNAFSWSAGLTAVTIAESVTTIGEDAFAYCSNLQEINWNAVAVNDCNGSIFRESGTMNGTIFGTGITVNIGDNVRKIPAHAFDSCYGLISVVISDSVTTIGSSAFEGCSNLITVVIPDSVTTIGDYAFASCGRLAIVTIGESVTTIGNYAFYYCYNLTDVYNKSKLNIIAGSEDNGYVGYYAQNIYNDESDSKLTLTDDGYIFYYNGTEAFLLGYYGAETDLILPDSFTTNDGTIVNSYAIKDSAFYSNPRLSSVTIGETVTAIGDYAFQGCQNLISATIGESVTKIGYGGFGYCNALTSVHYTGDISGWCSITFEDGYANPLSNGGSLYIDNQQVVDLVIPDVVTTIKSYTFYNCSGLTSVVIPDSVTAIEYNAFEGCTQLLEIEKGVSYVDKWAVDFDDSVAEVTLRNDTVGIADNTFSGCENLTSIVIPDKVTTIGRSAFDSCYGLTSITIGQSVATIEYYGFYRCYHLIEVYNRSELNITAGSWEYSYVAYSAENVYTEEGGSKLINTEDGYLFYGDVNNAYLVGYYGDEKELTLPDSFTAYDGTTVSSYGIYQYAFYHRDDLTSVVISDSVTSIGESAFSYCSGLTSVTIGDSVMTIGDFAFYGCAGLTSLTIPDSVISIQANAFIGCTQLVEIENGVSYVDKWMINCDDSVTEIIWRNDIFGIADCAFQGCAVTSVSIPDSVIIMGSSAFAWCDNLTSIVIPDSVTTIGNDAFYNCYMLNSVTFEDANGWQVSLNESFDESTTLSATDLSDPDTAAQYMTENYNRYYWRKV